MPQGDGTAELLHGTAGKASRLASFIVPCFN
jgi:hypothetical protein